MKLRRPSHGFNTVSTATMADIAFLLIIFFMLTTAFTVKKGLDLRLPDKEQRQPVKEDQIIILDILNNGTLTLAGKSIDITALRSTLRQNNTLNPEKFVIIQAQEDVTFERLIDVLDEVKQADIYNIAIPSRQDFELWFGKGDKIKNGQLF